jgi:hypothetical protein
VEPVENMRVKINASLPNVEVKEGAAEKIPFGDNSVDVVVAAQVREEGRRSKQRKGAYIYMGKRGGREIHRERKGDKRG